MKNFKTTLIFLLVVGVVVAFAIYDYKQQNAKEQADQRENRLYSDFTVADVTEFQLQGPQSFALQKKDKRWFFTQPFSDLADQTLFESYLSQIIHSDVIRIPAVELKKNRSYGLDKPSATISLKTADGRSHEIKVSSERTFDEGYYLQRDSDTDLYVGSNDWTSLINKLPNQLRNKELYLNSPEVVELTVTLKGQKSFTLLKSKDEWQLKEDSEFPASGDEIEAYISQLTSLRADDIVNESAPKRANDIQVRLVDKDGKTWELRVWNRQEGQGDLVVLEGQPQVYLIEDAQGSFIDRQLHELRDKKQPFQFEKSATKASITLSGEAAVEVTDAEKLQKLLNKVQNLRVRSYKPTAKGLFSSSLEFFDDKKQTLFKMEWSKKSENAGVPVYLVKTNRSPVAFELPETAVDELLDLVKPKEKEQTEKKAEAND